MSKTETIRVRVEPAVKRAAEAIFKRLGLSASDAVNMFYYQVELHKGIPFDLKIPNSATRKAMGEALSGKNMSTYNSLEELKKKFD